MQLFFVKRTIDPNVDGPRIVIPNSTDQFIGSNNYTYASAIGGGFRSYIMGAMKLGSTTAYYFLGYYPWRT